MMVPQTLLPGRNAPTPIQESHITNPLAMADPAKAASNCLQQQSRNGVVERRAERIIH
jgi:hypothetical protein